MLKSLLIHIRDEEQEAVNGFIASLTKSSDQELAEIYFRQQKVGITGVRMQLLYLYALRKVLIERFGNSPIEYDGVILEF